MPWRMEFAAKQTKTAFAGYLEMGLLVYEALSPEGGFPFVGN